MSADIRPWQIRLFIILVIGGGTALLLQQLLFGALFGLSGGNGGTLAIMLASSISFAVLGFFFEALPVALLGRPATSVNAQLLTHWRGGYLLAWLAMACTMVMFTAGLHFLLSKGPAVSPRWTYLGINLIAMAASAYAFIFMLNLRFAQNAWASDWQLPAWILLGGQAAWSLLMSFVYAALGSGISMHLVIGLVGQIFSAALTAYALGVWRGSIERAATPSGGIVF